MSLQALRCQTRKKFNYKKVSEKSFSVFLDQGSDTEIDLQCDNRETKCHNCLVCQRGPDSEHEHVREGVLEEVNVKEQFYIHTFQL